MQHVLQTALSVGFSATEGFHSDTPNKVDPSFDGMAAVLPQSFVPQTSTRITLKGKKNDVQIPWMAIGAWSWGDKATVRKLKVQIQRASLAFLVDVDETASRTPFHRCQARTTSCLVA
jgi:hypothetical protein